MNRREKFQALLILPKARNHIVLINKQLQSKPYDELLNDTYNQPIKKQSMETIVKAYLWGSRLLKKGNCLPRSIALFQHLKAAGFDVEHKFGVNKSSSKFAAHAWVEYNGSPLNESATLRKKFTVMD
ncbi:MAG: lasso peptide biosynthesis B2 protein [Xanthomonadales bacterium]|jgi:hypothetical protein|nr:lasso peptide biosynthesis B2 protein [Xanthomonadales bacterium]